jgi:hypothetical protein
VAAGIPRCGRGVLCFRRENGTADERRCTQMGRGSRGGLRPPARQPAPIQASCSEGRTGCLFDGHPPESHIGESCCQNWVIPAARCSDTSAAFVVMAGLDPAIFFIPAAPARRVTRGWPDPRPSPGQASPAMTKTGQLTGPLVLHRGPGTRPAGACARRAAISTINSRAAARRGRSGPPSPARFQTPVASSGC